MITYKITGCESTFKSKPENFDRDVLRWKQRNSLKHDAQVTILENDNISEPTIDWTSLGNPGELETLPEDTSAPKRSNKRKHEPEATDVQPVPHDVEQSDLSDDDKSITDWNDYPFESK